MASPACGVTERKEALDVKGLPLDDIPSSPGYGFQFYHSLLWISIN